MIRIALIALLLTTTLVFTAACGGNDEPVTPEPSDPPKEVGTTPEAPKPEDDTPEKPDTPAETPKNLWTLNQKNLAGYGAAFKDLKQNAPRVLKDATENALAMAKANDGLTFGNKAKGILETHGLTPESFRKFGDKLWPAVLAVAPDQASKSSGLAGLAGDHTDSLKGAADEALKEYTKNVTAEDKAFVKENLEEILALLK